MLVLGEAVQAGGLVVVEHGVAVDTQCEEEHGRDESGAVLAAVAMEDGRRQARVGEAAHDGTDLAGAVGQGPDVRVAQQLLAVAGGHLRCWWGRLDVAWSPDDRQMQRGNRTREVGAFGITAQVVHRRHAQLMERVEVVGGQLVEGVGTKHPAPPRHPAGGGRVAAEVAQVGDPLEGDPTFRRDDGRLAGRDEREVGPPRNRPLDANQAAVDCSTEGRVF